MFHQNDLFINRLDGWRLQQTEPNQARVEGGLEGRETARVNECLQFTFLLKTPDSDH